MNNYVEKKIGKKEKIKVDDVSKVVDLCSLVACLLILNEKINLGEDFKKFKPEDIETLIKNHKATSKKINAEIKSFSESSD